MFIINSGGDDSLNFKQSGDFAKFKRGNNPRHNTV